MTTVETIDRSLTAAQERQDRELAALKRPDGSRLYADAEHTERERAVRQAYAAAQQEAQTALEQIMTEADNELATIDATDPLAGLTRADLELANLRLAFVNEDAGRMTPADIAARIDAARASSDRVNAVLWLRAGQRVLDTLAAQVAAGQRGVSGVETDADVRALREAVSAARATFEPAGKRATAEQRRDEASRRLSRLAVDQYLTRTYGRSAAAARR